MRPTPSVGSDIPDRVRRVPPRENRRVLIATAGAAPSVLAHQGGWDEALMVLVPIAVFTGLLALANRRAKALQARREMRTDRTRPDADAAPAAKRRDRPPS